MKREIHGAEEKAKQIRPEWVLRIGGKVNVRPEKNVTAGGQNGDIEIEVMTVEVLP